MSKLQLGFVVGYNSTDSRQPPEVMTVPDSFYPLLGRIIIKWALLEQELDCLTAALVSFNKSSNPGWGKLPFSKRWNFFEVQFTDFASGNAELTSEIADIKKHISNSKALRDFIAHKRVAAGIDEKGNFLRFQNENKRFPWTKRFREKDLIDSSLSITYASGALFRLTNLDHAQFLSSDSISLLQRLPDMGHLRLPMPKGRTPQP